MAEREMFDKTDVYKAEREALAIMAEMFDNMIEEEIDEQKNKTKYPKKIEQEVKRNGKKKNRNQEEIFNSLGRTIELVFLSMKDYALGHKFELLDGVHTKIEDLDEKAVWKKTLGAEITKIKSLISLLKGSGKYVKKQESDLKKDPNYILLFFSGFTLATLEAIKEALENNKVKEALETAKSSKLRSYYDMMESEKN